LWGGRERGGVGGQWSGPTTLENGHRYSAEASYLTLSTLYMRSQKQTSNTEAAVGDEMIMTM